MIKRGHPELGTRQQSSHAKVESTARYRGVELEDAFTIAESIYI